MAGDDAESDAGNGDADSDDAAGQRSATGGESAPGDVTVREATPADLIPVLNVLDAAMLDTERVEGSLADGDALIAVEEGRVLGALVLVGDGVDVGEATSSGERNTARLVDAVAVRRSRRGRGIGSALVNAAARRTDLVAEFDGRNRPFYRSLGFEIERIGPDRFRGRRLSEP